jgi:hypothetical protein
MNVFAPLQGLLGLSLCRQAVDWGLRHHARQRVRRLERLDAVAVQERTLLQRVGKARDTQFGRDHDFARIRSVRDFQQRVPLRDYERFWSEYWAPAFPRLRDVTWPGHLPYLALSSGTTSGATKYLPLSRELLASNRKAGLTSLALFRDVHPEAALFTGRLFFLGGSTELRVLTGNEDCPVLAGDLSGVVAREASPLLRPFAYPPLELALLRDWDEKMTRLAEGAARLPITMISGVPSWLLVLFDRLKQVTGKGTIAEVWPMLRLVIHGGTKFEPYRALFQREVGNPEVFFLETYPASEAFIASEDFRHGFLRLIPDHDIFFEFLPRDELDSARPARHTLREVEVGQQYAIVLTTCAGLWSYVLGDTICFERRDPLLLRFTGRTRYFLSAFGEHLISEEVEQAIARAAQACGASVVDFHVGPLFPETPNQPGRHRYLVEFADLPPDLGSFTRELDRALCSLNEDYDAHRQGDLTLLAPEVLPVRRGGFAEWMRARGKLGGQHKVPRMDNSGEITRELTGFFGP